MRIRRAEPRPGCGLYRNLQTPLVALGTRMLHQMLTVWFAAFSSVKRTISPTGSGLSVWKLYARLSKSLKEMWKRNPDCFASAVIALQ